jgi:hypothetical protein
MIREYKLYHGAVLVHLVDCLRRPVAIEEFVEDGRLTTYVLDGRIGLHIKHSLQRLTPWQFTFTAGNVRELGYLQMNYTDAFIVLVCRMDGMVCLTIDEVKSLLSFGRGDQASIRVSRHRNEQYSVSSATAELPQKRADGVGMIVDRLTAGTIVS